MYKRLWPGALLATMSAALQSCKDVSKILNSLTYDIYSCCIHSKTFNLSVPVDSNHRDIVGNESRTKFEDLLAA